MRVGYIFEGKSLVIQIFHFLLLARVSFLIVEVLNKLFRFSFWIRSDQLNLLSDWNNSRKLHFNSLVFYFHYHHCFFAHDFYLNLILILNLNNQSCIWFFIIIIKNIAWSSFILFLVFNLFPFLYRLLQSCSWRLTDSEEKIQGKLLQYLRYLIIPIYQLLYEYSKSILGIYVCVLLFLLLWVVVLLHSFFIIFLNSWKIHEIVVKIRSYWCLLVFFLF